MIKRSILMLGLATAMMVGGASASEYYKWVDEQGTTRYAESPPHGVVAEKINTHAGSASAYNPNNENNDTDEARKAKAHKAELEAKTKKLEDDAVTKCKMVQDQHKTLSERGRVRVKEKDGTERMLTPEEQAAKILEMDNFLKKTCSDQ
jgi:hypothetical protein